MDTSYQNTPSTIKVRVGKLECAGGHVELPLVLDLAVHLFIFWGRWVKGIILRHLLLALFYQNNPSSIKVRGRRWECAGCHVRLPLVLDLAVHLEIFWGRWVNRIILRYFYYKHFFTRAPLHA